LNCYINLDKQERRRNNMNIGVILLIIIGGSVGLLANVYLLISFPAVIIWKFYRKLRFHLSMYQ
jgi:hypothetical protein